MISGKRYNTQNIELEIYYLQMKRYSRYILQPQSTGQGLGYLFNGISTSAGYFIPNPPMLKNNSDII